MRLDPLFHWSPRDRRQQILAEGLRPYAAPVCHHGRDLRWPYVCLAATPSAGWSLSGMAHPGGDEIAWDLWQVRLDRHDEVHVRETWGPDVEEVRVRSAIPADRVWLVGERAETHALYPDAANRKTIERKVAGLLRERGVPSRRAPSTARRVLELLAERGVLGPLS